MCWRCGFRRFGCIFPMLTMRLALARVHSDTIPYSKMRDIPLDELCAYGAVLRRGGSRFPCIHFSGAWECAAEAESGRFLTARRRGLWREHGQQGLVAGTDACISACATPRALFEVGNGHAGGRGSRGGHYRDETSLVGRFSLWCKDIAPEVAGRRRLHSICYGINA